MKAGARAENRDQRGQRSEPEARPRRGSQLCCAETNECSVQQETTKPIKPVEVAQRVGENQSRELQETEDDEADRRALNVLIVDTA